MSVGAVSGGTKMTKLYERSIECLMERWFTKEEKDLENTIYRFSLEDGTVVEAKGNEEIEYDGETHTVANLYDALKEGYYGKF